jgi:hypothetical protein
MTGLYICPLHVLAMILTDMYIKLHLPKGIRGSRMDTVCNKERRMNRGGRLKKTNII